MSLNDDDDVDEVCIEKITSEKQPQEKTVNAPAADNTATVTGCLIITVILSLLYYGGCHAITFFTGGNMGAITTVDEIKLDKRSFVGKTIAA